MKRNVKRHDVVQPQDQSYRLIALTQNLNATVDAEDYEWLMERNWCTMWQPTSEIFYALSGRETMHRAIAARAGLSDVDHHDGDGLNNRRKNLRPCTRSQNAANGGMYSTNTTGFKGVYLQNNRYRASIFKDGNKISLGFRDTAEEAARLRDAGMREHFGEFARLNFSENS